MYEEYQSYISFISSSLIIVHDNINTYKTLCKLCGNGKPYEYIMREHPLFWKIFLENLYTSTIINLFKILDNDKDSITIKELIRMFNKDYSKQTEAIQEIVALQEDIEKIARDVKPLRNKRYAHWDKKYTLDPSKTFNATWGNIEDLTTNSEKILEKISQITLGVTYLSYHKDLELDIEETIKSFAHNANEKQLSNE